MTNELGLDSLRKFVDQLRGDKPKTPSQIVTEQMSSRLTKGADDATSIRVGLFLGDLVRTTEGAILEVASGKPGKDDETLTREIKETRGYGTLTLGGIHVEDKTISDLINQAKVGLANEYSRHNQS